MEVAPLASKTMYVLVIQNKDYQGQYLRATCSSWGPDSLVPTKDLLEALQFSTVAAAQRYAAKPHGWRCIPAAVRVSVTLRPGSNPSLVF